jgi:hypothetical protein
MELGWVLLSRRAIGSAEAALKPDQQGVRDEIGFLAIHQGFADRFFPGTSVLHTRLRYALFVPWLMVKSDGNRERLKELEHRLTGQLRKQAGDEDAAERDGVIGGRRWPGRVAQLPSMVYWTALTTWGVVLPRPDGVRPPRSAVLKALAANRRQRLIDSDEADGANTMLETPFARLPPPPPDLAVAGARLSFALTDGERRFLSKHLVSVLRPQSDRASLLSSLAKRGVPDGANAPWSRAVLESADEEDREAMVVARQASSLAAVGRAVYASLVEERKEFDGTGTSRLHREDLQGVLTQHGALASRLDVPALQGLVAVPTSLLPVLHETQNWLRRGAKRLSNLEVVYASAERSRKGLRARLGSLDANRKRREEWNGDEHPLASPLHYRWSNVRTLLDDLGT